MDESYAGIEQVQAQLGRREISSRELVSALISRIESIDQAGPTLRSVIQVNPEAEVIADRLDRSAAEDRGPLHGIPILLKDNIDTADSMATTAGSMALVDNRAQSDAIVVKRLRDAGAVILGKTNLSEWANFRSTHSSSGWSARGGQCRNPYALDRTPCGSSSGSAAAVAAGFAPASIGTETDGSILCPGAMCGVVGVKPTVGLTNRSGVIPISHTQDTIGPFARTVSDAALVLSVLAESESNIDADLVTSLDLEALKGARIGVARSVYFGYSAAVDAVAERSIDVIRQAGATVIDPADIPTAKEIKSSKAELTVLLFEFKHGLNAYLGQMRGTGPRTLSELIQFNLDHASVETPFFDQELFLMAEEKGSLEDPQYLECLRETRRMGREAGIDAVMAEHRLDALIMPTTGPAFTIDHVNGDHYSGGSSGPAAIAGYPAVTVPAGYVRGLPIGITFLGRAFSEATLLRLAHAFEQRCEPWQAPQFLSTIVE